jgi:hypothetical protein
MEKKSWGAGILAGSDGHPGFCPRTVGEGSEEITKQNSCCRHLVSSYVFPLILMLVLVAKEIFVPYLFALVTHPTTISSHNTATPHPSHPILSPPTTPESTPLLRNPKPGITNAISFQRKSWNHLHYTSNPTGDFTSRRERKRKRKRQSCVLRYIHIHTYTCFTMRVYTERKAVNSNTMHESPHPLNSHRSRGGRSTNPPHRLARGIRREETELLFVVERKLAYGGTDRRTDRTQRGVD